MDRKCWLGFAMASLLIVMPMYAFAQTVPPQKSTASEDELIEVGLTFLPPSGSVEYASLRQIGDVVMGMPLKLSHGEIWKIKRNRLEALREAAKKVGATLVAFGAAVPNAERRSQADAKLTAFQEKLVASIGDLASAVKLSIVQATHFELLEYGGAGSTPNGAGPIKKLRLGLDNGVEIVATRVSTDVKDDLIVWRGRVDATNEPFNIYLGRGGMVTGEIRHENFKYWFRPLGGGLLAVAKIDESRLPEEHGVTDLQLFKRIEQLAQGENPAQKARALHFKDLLGQSDDPRKMPPPGEQGPATIDVMVAYTSKVAKRYLDVEFELIRPAIENTNDSFRNSGLGDIAVRLVHIHKTDYDESAGEHFDHVWRMVDRGDGYMEEIPGLRDQYKADAVILIVDSAKGGCGLATRVAPDAPDAYAVVHHECAGLTYSLAHELGHIIGARHDRGVDKGAPDSYGHGYIDRDKKWRSMMAYKQDCNGCPRFPIWSSPSMTVNGKPAGDALDDNARVIREQAVRVSKFR